MVGERVGKVLLEEGVITAEDVARVIDDGGFKGSPLAKALKSTPCVKQADLIAFLGADTAVPRLEDLRKVDLSRTAIEVLPAEVARRLCVVPVALVGDVLILAAAEKTDSETVAEVRKAARCRIKLLIADEDQVWAAIRKEYEGKKEEIPAPKGTEDKVEEPEAAPVEEIEDLPLISGGGEQEEEIEELELEEVDAAPPKPVDALHVSKDEFDPERRAPAVRMALDFDAIHNAEKAIPAIRVS